MMDCCGKKVETPFCPLCGKPIADARIRLRSLLAYLQIYAKQKEQGLKDTVRRAEEDLKDETLTPRQRERRSTWIKKDTNKFNKWDGWAEAVEYALKVIESKS